MSRNEMSAQLWQTKFEIYKHLLSVRSFRSVVYSVLDRDFLDAPRTLGATARDQALAYNVYGCMCKWIQGESTPSYGKGVKRFFDRLAKLTGVSDEMTGAMLIEASIEEFIGFLPERNRRLASNALKMLQGRSGQTEAPSFAASLPIIDLDDDLSAIWLQHAGPIPTIAAGLRDRKIDQRHYYLDPGSTDNWARIVDSQSYPTYDHCLAGLEDLLKSTEWKRCLGACQPRTAVMLAGGGAPDKDLMLIRNLLNQQYVQGRVYHYLLDISMYMLRDSAMWLSEHLGSLAKKVVLKPIHRDVLSLTTRDSKRLHEHGSVIFAITGGTIGNLSESAFFRSLGQVAVCGDLLIVSADTIDQLSKEDQDKLKDNYDNDDLRLWLTPVVRAILGQTNEREHLDGALRRIKVELLPVGQGQASDVSQSRSMVVTLKVDREEVTLLTSTRYQSSQLTAFASSFGWQSVCAIPSRRNPHFKQFLFRRKDAETSGS